jgi:norsolorinic acid ketoreductase
MSAAPVPIQEGVNGMIEQIDKATREHTSGKFMAYNGEQVPW